MSSSSVSVKLESASVTMPVSDRTRSRLRVAAYTVFGITFLVASIYLVLCYITFDFFGALQSPFFGWLRGGATVVHYAYFPLLAAALISVVGKRGSLA